MRRPAFLLALLLGFVLQPARNLFAETPPLHTRIDQLVQASAVAPLAPLCDDATFVRRAYLDLWGVIPTAAEARTFLENKSPEKREQLVRMLTASERFNRRLVEFFDVMLMERRGDKHIKVAEWRKYLLDSIRENKPYNVLVREIIAEDGTDENLRPAAKFFLDRDSEPNLMTRDIGRILFGMDLQCAQCHDHPLVDDYYQRDYYGLYSFVNRTTVFDDKKAKKKFLAEKAEGDVDYKSVFTEQSGFARPRLPGEPSVSEPVLKLGDEYQVAPAKDVRGVPKYSRRQTLAKLIETSGNDRFRRNIANRLWALVMGRGLVEPVDFHHTSNPPTNPELLQLLADEIHANGYDIKAFLQQLLLTETYQRSLTSVNDSKDPKALQTLAQQLQEQQQQMEETVKQADVAYLQLIEAVTEVREEMLPVRAERDKARKAWSEAVKKSTAAAKPVAETTKKRDAEKKVVDALAPALAPAQQAASLLGDDKALTDAVQKLKARHDKHAAQLAALEKTLATQAAATKTANEAVAKSIAAFDVKRTELRKLDDKTRALEQQLAAADRERRQLVLQQKQLKERETWTQSLLSGLEARTQLASLRKQLTEAAEQRTAWNNQLALQQKQAQQLTAQLPQLQVAVKQAEKKQAEMLASIARMGDAQGELQSLQTQVTALGTQLKDEQLNQVAQQLVVKQQALTREMTAVEGQRAAHDRQVADAHQQLKATQDKLAELQKTSAQLQQRQEALVAKQTQLSEQLAAAEARRVEAEAQLEASLTEQNAVAALKPLAPEQLAWSMMQIGGVIEKQIASTQAALDKAKPLDEAAKKDETALAAREQEVITAALDKLASGVGSFVKLYGGGPGQPQNEFFATVDQALFVSNGGQIRSWFAIRAAQLNKEKEAAKLAEELYLTVLTRMPDADETRAVAEYLEGRDKDRQAAVEEMIWALATSVEFRFGH